jgi:hypothetical protein
VAPVNPVPAAPSLEAPAPAEKYPSGVPAAPGSVVPKTFQPNGGAPAAPTTAIPGSNSGLGVLPELIGPENRTTARPVYQTGYVQLIALPSKTAPVHTSKLDDGGWRASHD